MMKYFTFACCSYLIFLNFLWELGAAASNIYIYIYIYIYYVIYLASGTGFSQQYYIIFLVLLLVIPYEGKRVL